LNNSGHLTPNSEKEKNKMERNASFVKENSQLQAKYAHLLEGISHPSKNPRDITLERNKMAILFENATQDFCINNGFRDMKHIEESVNLSTAATTFLTTRLPMIRQIYSKLVARQLVSIQPMTQPDTRAFYYDFYRDDSTKLNADSYNQRNYSNSTEYVSGTEPGDFDPSIKELELVVTGTTVSATTKKLKTQWTVELEQDIYAYHGIDVKVDLHEALVTNIIRELDYTLLYTMYAGATGGSATFDQTVPDGISYQDRKFWMEGICEKMVDIDNQIFKKTYRKTTWAVTTPDIAAFLEKMGGFVANPDADQGQIISTGGRYFSGTLNKRWKIIVDPFFPDGKMMLGYSGNSWLECCCVFMPYIPLFFVDGGTEAHSFKKVMACMTRNGIFLCRPDQIGILTVTGS
jgi:hypothetical protein